VPYRANTEWVRGEAEDEAAHSVVALDTARKAFTTILQARILLLALVGVALPNHGMSHRF